MLESNTFPQPDLSPAAESSALSHFAYSPYRVTQLRTRKIAILGFGRTAKDCPWQDDTWELWAMNGFWRAAEPDHGIKVPEERYTLWFDLHTMDYTRAYGKVANIEGLQEAWLQKDHPFKVFMLEEEPGLPSVVRFPIEGLIEKLGRDYFTSTVAYALAYALAQDDVAEIGLWGIDLTHNTEYAEQRPCAEYWIGRAEQMGIRVTIHEDSALLKQRGRYGYDDLYPLAKELRGFIHSHLEKASSEMGKNRAEMERLRDQMHTDDGAIQTLNGILDRIDVWSRGGKLA
jgi:hypothetical protein